MLIPAASNVKSDCMSREKTLIEMEVQMTKVPGGRKRFGITESQVLKVANCQNPRILYGVGGRVKVLR